MWYIKYTTIGKHTNTSHTASSLPSWTCVEKEFWEVYKASCSCKVWMAQSGNGMAVKEIVQKCYFTKASYTRTHQMVRKPNVRMCGWDCEPALCRPRMVRIPLAANWNLSVCCANTKRTGCPRCPFHAPGVLCSHQVRGKLINRMPNTGRTRMAQLVSGALVYTRFKICNICILHISFFQAQLTLLPPATKVCCQIAACDCHTVHKGRCSSKIANLLCTSLCKCMCDTGTNKYLLLKLFYFACYKSSSMLWQICCQESITSGNVRNIL